MRAVFVISLLVVAVAAGNWNTNKNWNNNDNHNYNYNYKNDRRLTERDVSHQKFILYLLHHLQQDIHYNEFMQYSQTIRLDNKNDYKDLNKVYYLVSLYQNGWFEQRNKPFSVFKERNMITTKALFDFFHTMQDWNTVAINLIWARCNINEYQFWHLINLLVTHNRHFNNIVLPAAYEVFPSQFFTADVMTQGVNTFLNFGNDFNERNNFVIMSNYTTGVLGSNDNDDNNNVYDLNDIMNGNNKIQDWDTMKKVMHNIKNQLMMNNNNQYLVNGKNRDVKNKVWNNNRNLNQGSKFDNNGEDRLVYFTEDIGLNNFFYFSRMGQAKIVDDKKMYDNINNKENFNMKNGLNLNNDEVKDKINRRGERYLYEIKQLLARYNLERTSNGLDNVQDLTLDGTIDNGVYPNLRYTNGIQMQNRMNGYNLKTKGNMRLIQVTNDFENRFYRAIDQGFVLTQNGNKVNLQNKNGINILGNLLQGNDDSVNNQYYRNLELYYRLLFGGNHLDNVDFTDNRFVPTVLDHLETSMRDPVFWQIMKRITNIVNKYQNNLTGYKTQDVDFNGVKINNVKVDKLITTFNYFDVDITNGINMNKKFINNNFNFHGNNGDFDSDESGINSDSSSMEDSNEFFGNKNNYGNNQGFNNRKYNQGNRMYNGMDNDMNNGRGFNTKYNNFNDVLNTHRNNMHDSNESNDSNDSNSSSNESNDSNDSNSNENGNFGNYKNYKNYKNINRNNFHNKQQFNNRNNPQFNNRKYNRNGNDFNRNNNVNTNFQGFSRQVNYWNRNNDNTFNNMNIVARTRRMDTKLFTVSIDVQSNKNQLGVVRIFLGTRINNKQQLNDNRHNFVELDQFIVQLNQGNNLIKRNSVDFKNVVGDPLSMNTLYRRSMNQLKNNGNENKKNIFNYDTINNNHGFPHRLVLPKGTVGGEDYTLFVIVSNLDDNNYNYVQFNNNNMATGTNFFGNNDSGDSNDSNSSSDSNESNDSNVMNDNNKQFVYRHNYKNGNDYNKFRYGNNLNDNKNWIGDNSGKGLNQNMKGNWVDYNGVMIYNFNKGNDCIGNGNGVLDNRAMGFPLDRQILDVTGFITKNMFFRDVVIFHNDNYTQGNNMNDNFNGENY